MDIVSYLRNRSKKISMLFLLLLKADNLNYKDRDQESAYKYLEKIGKKFNIN